MTAGLGKGLGTYRQFPGIGRIGKTNPKAARTHLTPYTISLVSTFAMDAHTICAVSMYLVLPSFFTAFLHFGHLHNTEIAKRVGESLGACTSE